VGKGLKENGILTYNQREVSNKNQCRAPEVVVEVERGERRQGIEKWGWFKFGHPLSGRLKH